MAPSKVQKSAKYIRNEATKSTISRVLDDLFFSGARSGHNRSNHHHLFFNFSENEPDHDLDQIISDHFRIQIFYFLEISKPILDGAQKVPPNFPKKFYLPNHFYALIFETSNFL